MNVLILHALGPKPYRPRFQEDLELAVPTYAPAGVRCLVHDLLLGTPDFFADVQPDLVLIGPTAMAFRHREALWAGLHRHCGFLAALGIPIFAFPQDDYYYCGTMDEFFTAWRLARVYSVCPGPWESLYPRYLAAGGHVELGYTSYMTPALRRQAAAAPPRQGRHLDVGYRGGTVPYLAGRLGLAKARLPQLAQDLFRDTAVRFDVQAGTGCVIRGRRWLDYLADCRFIMGCNSGSSLRIPDAAAEARIKSYLAAHPGASFDELEANCFPGEDGRYVYTAVSPRNIEAAVTGTVQLLLPGEYGGILRPGHDYWPVQEDLSNRQEVLDLIADEGRAAALAENCRQTMCEHPALCVEKHVQRLLAAAASLGPQTGAGDRAFARFQRRYNAWLGTVGRARVWLYMAKTVAQRYLRRA